MKISMEDFVWFLIGGLSIIIFIAAIILAVNGGRERENVVKQTELNTGCEYLGSPKGVPRLGYFDCNGAIQIRRIP